MKNLKCTHRTAKYPMLDIRSTRERDSKQHWEDVEDLRLVGIVWSLSKNLQESRKLIIVVSEHNQNIVNTVLWHKISFNNKVRHWQNTLTFTGHAHLIWTYCASQISSYIEHNTMEKVNIFIRQFRSSLRCVLLLYENLSLVPSTKHK